MKFEADKWDFTDGPSNKTPQQWHRVVQTANVNQKAPQSLVLRAGERFEAVVRGLGLWSARHLTGKWGNLMNPTQECFDYCCLAPRGKVYTPHPDDCSLAFPCSVIITTGANFLFVHLELWIICLSISNSSGSWSTSILPWIPHLRTSRALDSKWSDRDSGNVLNVE